MPHEKKNEEWTLDIDNEEWKVSAEGEVAERLGPVKRSWIEQEIKRHYEREASGEGTLTFAGARYRGPSGEYEIAIDFDHDSREITVSKPI
jgi:hypothetical protein